MILKRLYILISLILATLAAGYLFTATIQNRIQHEIIRRVHKTAHETIGKSTIQRVDYMLNIIADQVAGKTGEQRRAAVKRAMEPFEELKFEGYTQCLTDDTGKIIYLYSSDIPGITAGRENDDFMDFMERFRELERVGGGYQYYSTDDDATPEKFIYVSKIPGSNLRHCIITNIDIITNELGKIFLPLNELNATFSRITFIIVGTTFIFILLASFQTIKKISILEKERKIQNLKLKETNTLLEVEVNVRKRIEDELKEANSELERISSRDGLTGLANRRHYEEYIKTEWERMARERKPLSILLCDVDHFKKYNDTYGHLGGDSCLQSIAGVIRDSCRRPADMPARYGGEEFIVALPDTDGPGAVQVAEKIRSGVENLRMEHRASEWGFVTLSIGVATTITSGDTTRHSLTKKADIALYRAKEYGRNRTESC